MPMCVWEPKCAVRLGELVGLPCCLVAWCCACACTPQASACVPSQCQQHAARVVLAQTTSHQQNRQPVTCAATSSALLYTFSCQLKVLVTWKASGRPDVLGTAAAGLSAPAAAPALLLLMLGVACSRDTTRACSLACNTRACSCLRVQLYLGCRCLGCAQQRQRDPQLEAGHGVLGDIVHGLLVLLHV